MYPIFCSVSLPDSTTLDSADQINNYACQVMELGMLFISLQDLVHLPHRERGLRLLKFLMLVMKNYSNRSKYAIEIMRFLVHQVITLNNQETQQMFYSLFVNTKGKIESHIAADDEMEGMVGVIKKHIHHMYSNKTEHNIQNKTRALGGIKLITEQYDMTTKTITRSRKHTTASCKDDEASMLKDLRKVRPFSTCPGRIFMSGTTANISALTGINTKDTRQWVQMKKYIYATEKGN